MPNGRGRIGRKDENESSAVLGERKAQSKQERLGSLSSFTCRWTVGMERSGIATVK